MNNKIVAILFFSLILFSSLNTASAVTNVTTTMQTIWDLVANLVSNTDAIIGLFLISIIIMVLMAIGNFIKNTLNKGLDKRD